MLLPCYGWRQQRMNIDIIHNHSSKNKLKKLPQKEVQSHHLYHIHIWGDFHFLFIFFFTIHYWVLFPSYDFLYSLLFFVYLCHKFFFEILFISLFILHKCLCMLREKKIFQTRLKERKKRRISNIISKLLD